MSTFDNWETRPPEVAKAEEAAKETAAKEKTKNRLKELALALVDSKEKQKALEVEIEEASRELASHFPDEEGEHTEIVEDVAISVMIKPNWKWDSDKLEAKFAGAALPEHVKRRLSIARPDYEKLDPTEKAALDDALSIAKGSPRIRIKVQGKPA